MSFRILLAKSDCWWALESVYVGQFLKKPWETLQNIELQVGLENLQILMWIRKTLSNMLLPKKTFRSGLMCLSFDIIAGGDYQYFRSLSKKKKSEKWKISEENVTSTSYFGFKMWRILTYALHFR